MQLAPLQHITNIEPFVSGDVKIDPSVAIAPGVIIQAADNCQIIIGSGVCIGMGAIIHAYQGNIEIESGATIGSGVLLVGKSKIGANACVGALATIIEEDVEVDKVVLPASIIGNSGRQILDNSTTSLPHQGSAQSYLSSDETQENNNGSNLANTSSSSEENQTETEPANTQLKSTNTFSSSEENHTETEPANTQLQSVNTFSSSEENHTENQTETEQANTELQSANTSSSSEENQIETEKANTQLQSANTFSSSEETDTETEQANTQLQEEASPNIDPQIYGKEYVNQIMKTLFPHKNSLSPHPDDED
ncbi:hypothetical protein [Dapis sp. BLCC M172]|uniref:acyltransferase n=1 Tax=Dapis sp. BLCC M172 TaxID=2975281 RepID=UPI003CF88D70